MFQNKGKKTTLQKQFSRNIMGVITGIFIVLGIITSSFTYKSAVSFSNVILPIISGGIKQEISTIDFEDFLNEESNEAKDLEKIKGNISEYGENIEMLLGDFAIIIKNDEEYVYLHGIKDGEEIATGEIVTNINEPVLNVFSTGEEYYSTVTREMIVRRVPIEIVIPIIQEGVTRAVINMHIKTDIILNIILGILGFAIGGLIVVLVAIRIMVGFVTRLQTRSIDVLVHKMKELSNLEGDLTKRIQINSHNEIGELAEYTNQMLDTIQKIMIQINENAIFLNETSAEFAKLIKDTATSAATIDVAIDTMTNNTDRQTVATLGVRDQVNSINESVNQVAINAQNVTEEATKTSHNANDGKKAMDDMKDYVQKAVSQVETTGERVEELNNLSNQINAIVDAITNIASQTNLLALNASIEAARAGEHGKGFAVVAEEVRKLAEESAKQSEDIATLIHRVQESIELAGSSMDEAIETMETENTMVDHIANRFTGIVDSITVVSNMVEEVSCASEEMAAGTSVVTDEIDQFSDVAKDNAEATNSVARNMLEQNERVQQLANDIDKIGSIATDLNDLLKDITLE